MESEIGRSRYFKSEIRNSRSDGFVNMRVPISGFVRFPNF